MSTDTQTIRTINGKPQTILKTDLPLKPFVGLAFTPDGTDSIATITHIEGKAHGKSTVTYSFDHAPDSSHSRGYQEVRALGWRAA